MKMLKQNRKQLKDRCSLALAAAGIYGLLTAVHIGCPIRFLTGISCAGCGMTRAFFLALSFDFGQAFYMHPLYFTAPLLVFVFLFEGLLPKKAVKLFWISAGIVFLAVYILRLFGGSAVVTAEPRDGLICRLLRIIWKAV